MFKSLLKTGRLLRDFFEAFLPDVHAFIDFDHIEFVDKERFTMQGKRRTGDLLIKTKFRGGSRRLAPVPFRIVPATQRKKDADQRRRTRTHADKNQIGSLSALVSVGQRPSAPYAFASIRNITQAAWSESELESVSSFFFAYREFGIEDALKLKEELSMIESMELPKAILEKNPIFQFGMDKGAREGQQQGEANLVLRLLARRVGDVTPAQEAAIRKLPLADIEALGEALLDFVSAADLAGWLQSHSG